MSLIAVGCGDETTALDVTLKLSDPVFQSTGHARIIVRKSDGTSFQTMQPQVVRKGLSVRKLDVDGDGIVEIAIELGQDFAFDRENRFRLSPGLIAAPLNVQLEVETFDPLENRVARLGGRTAQTRVGAVLTPGLVTKANVLEPTCIAECNVATLKLLTADAQQLAFDGTSLDAMVAGNMTGQTPRRADLVISSAHEGRDALPNVGRVEIRFGGPTVSTAADVTVLGAEAGGQLGSALAVADLDADGIDDLVIGAPGAAATSGAVYVFYGSATWPAVLDVGMLPETAAVVTGGRPGDRVGESLLLVDVDGDGKLEVLAGAPGASKVYTLGAAIARGARGDLVLEATPPVKGPAGSEFGRTLTAGGDSIVVSAPLATEGQSVGIVYLLTRSHFLGQVVDVGSAPHILGVGGGFGSALTLATLDGSGTPPWLAVGAPEIGNGTTYLFALDGISGVKGVSDAPRTIRVSAQESGGATNVGRLGATLGVLRWPLGDALVLGAPSILPSPSPGAGALFIVRGATMQKEAKLLLSADGWPAQALLAGDRPGDALGSHVVVADFNQDGKDDLAVAAAKAKTVYITPGPFL